jgi:hypothetical protein
MNGIIDVKLTDGESFTEPVILDDVKVPLELDGTFHDTYLTRLIKTAREYTEKYLNRSLIARTVEATILNEQGGQLLPYGLVPETITVIDEDANVLDSEITGTGNFKYLKSPIGGPFIVSYTVTGYTADTIPETIRTSIIQAVVYWFENRGDTGKLPQEAKNTMRFERVKDTMFW